jgi:hypothetical protein
MPSCAAAAKGKQTNANAKANLNAFSSPDGPISGPSGGTLDPPRWRVKGPGKTFQEDWPRPNIK